MVNKEIKRLSRRELVDVIYQLKRNEQQMQEKIAELEAALEEKRIRLSTAGSLADAAVDITNVFSTAQTAADLYLHEINCMKQDTEQACAQKVEETQKRVEEILAEGKRQYEALAARYQADYQKWQQLQADLQRLEAQMDTNGGDT